MAIETISSVFGGLATMAESLQFLDDYIHRQKGAARALYEEIKHNLRLSWLVVKMGVEPKSVIPALRTETYDDLITRGFNFNKLKHRPFHVTEEMTESDLAFLDGWETDEVIENIYDRIKDVKALYRFKPDDTSTAWRRRVININKRILALLQHLDRTENGSSYSGG